jgi:ComEC/Rec2-related protein
MLFFLGFFCYAIGIGCGIIWNHQLSLELSILFPLIIFILGWWKHWYIVVLAVSLSIGGWYLWNRDFAERTTAYNILSTETHWFSGTYIVRWTVEKILYNSNLSNTYRLKIDTIDNRSTKKIKILNDINIGIFLEIPNNLHITMGDTIEYSWKIMKVIDFPLKWFSGYSWYHKVYGKSTVPIFKRIVRAEITPLGKIQTWAKSVLFIGFPENIAGIILGMTIGNIELLASETKKSFTNAGITHILVVSGSNIAFVIVILTSILRYIPIGRIIRTLVVVVFVLGYGSLVGWDMPVLRAVAMGIITYIAIEWWKKISSISILFLVGWCILLYSPLALIYDAGFGLSFAGTLGILLFHPPLQSMLSYRYVPRFLIDIVGVTIAASIGSIVAIIYHFNTIPVFSLISNILISGFLGWILFSSVIYLLFALIGWWILYIWGWTIYLPTSYIMWVGEFFGNGYIYTLDSMVAEPLAIFMVWLLISVIFSFEKKKILDSK